MDIIEKALLEAIYNCGDVLHPEQVVVLTRAHVREAEGIVYAVDVDGKARYHGDGHRLAATEVVAEFLAAKPHYHTKKGQSRKVMVK